MVSLECKSWEYNYSVVHSEKSELEVEGIFFFIKICSASVDVINVVVLNISCFHFKSAWSKCASYTTVCTDHGCIYVLRLRVHNKLLSLNTVHNMFCQTMNDASYILYIITKIYFIFVIISAPVNIPFCKLPVNFPQQFQDFHIFSTF